jgi:putative ABC transport system substrate-binding protein
MSPYRRRLILASMLAVGGIAAAAESGRKVFRVAYLSNGSTESSGSYVEDFRRALRALGYDDGPGGNLSLAVRYADGDLSRLPALAVELVALKPDVMVANTYDGIDAVRRVAKGIPIVMRGTGDPVKSGLVKSLARPGGNITGISTVAPDLSPKMVQIIHALAPDATRLGYLMQDGPTARDRLRLLQESAKLVGVTVVEMLAGSPAEIQGAFASLARDKVKALIVSPDNMTVYNMQQIIDSAARARLPAIYYSRQFVERGGLVSYGVDRAKRDELVAEYVDKILKGASPASLPVQQLDKFELAINLKTARALGIKVPHELLVGAVLIE